MTDIANLGIQVDSKQVKTATDDLNKLTEASKKTEQAVGGVGKSAQAAEAPFKATATATAGLFEQLTRSNTAAAVFSGVMKGVIGSATLWGAAASAAASAADFMWTKIVNSTASKSFDDLLKEQNTLLKTSRDLILRRADAQVESDVTFFRNMRTRIQLEEKLASMAKDSLSRVSRPTAVGMPEIGMPSGFMPGTGETGGITALPGMEKLAGAVEKFNASIRAGRPDVIAFRAEISAIGRTAPELQPAIDKFLELTDKMAEGAVAANKAAAMEKALKGIATSADLAAAGIRMSAAELALLNIQLPNAAAQAERAAEALITLMQSHGTTSESVARTLEGLDQQNRLIQARVDGTEASVAAEIAYEKAILAGVDALDASKIAAATRRNELARAEAAEAQVAQRAQQVTAATQQAAQAAAQFARQWNAAADAYEDLERRIGFSAAIQAFFDPGSGEISTTRFGNSPFFTRQDGSITQFNPQGYTSTLRPMLPQETLEDTVNRMLYNGKSVQEVLFETLKRDPASQIAQDLTTLLPENQQASYINAQIGALRMEKPTLENLQLIQKLTDSLKTLTTSTDNLSATMTEALSPFYSQDPRTTKLGFRAGVVGNPDWMMGGSNANPVAAITGWTGGVGVSTSGGWAGGVGITGYPSGIPGVNGFANGGSFIVPGGYSSTDNKLVAFRARSGERVSIGESGGGPIMIDNSVTIQGNVDQGTLAKLKRSQFQMEQRTRSMIAG